MKKVITLAYLMLMGYHSIGQREGKENLFWGEVGVGAGQNVELNAAASAYYNSKKDLYALSLEHHSQKFLALFEPPGKSLTALTFKYGKIYKQPYWFASAQAGFGIAKYSEPFIDGFSSGSLFSGPTPTYDTRSSIIATVPVEAKIGVKFHVVTINLSGGMQINHSFPQLYYRLSFGVGWL